MVGGAALALMPFNDGTVQCGPPLLGAKPSHPVADGNGHLLVFVPACTGPGVGRLLLGTGLVVAGLVMTAVALSIGLWRSERQAPA
jgi:hypothetical protein